MHTVKLNIYLYTLKNQVEYLFLFITLFVDETFSSGSDIDLSLTQWY